MEKMALVLVLLASVIVFLSISEKSKNPRKIEKLAEIGLNTYTLDSPPIRVESIQSSFANSISSTADAESEMDVPHSKNAAVTDYLPVSLSAIQVKQKESVENRFGVINDRLAREPTKSVIDVMGALFDEEPTDLLWARENEENIYNFFRNGSSFISFSPESVDCKSLSCKVIISVPDENAGMDIQNKISYQSSIDPSKILNNYSATVDPKSAKLIIYFQKDEM